MQQQNKNTSHSKIGGNKKVEKAKNFKGAMSSLFRYCKKYLGLIIISAILATATSVLAVIGPNKLRDLTNEIQAGLGSSINISVVLNIMYILIAIYLISSTCMSVQNILMAKVSQKVSKKLRSDISKKINRVPIKFIDKTPHGDLLSRVTNDVDTISQGLNNTIGTLVHSTTLVLATIIMMFVTNPILALTTIVCSLLGFVLIILIMKKSQKYFVAQQKELGAVNGHIEEIYSGLNIVSVYNATTEENQKFDTLNKKLYKNAFMSQFLGGLMMPIMIFIGNFGYVAVCVIGAILVLHGKTDIGTIVAFIMYARIFTNQLTQASQAFSFLQSTAAASERVFELLNEEELQNESHKTLYLSPSEVKGNVSFKNICFGYDDNKNVINNFSIDIQSGKKVAIVGKTGAGKTTIVNLLMRFYELNSGDITIDGISTKDLTRENIHELFGMVLQDTWLFEGTIRENLLFNNTASQNRIAEVCKACGIDHFINSLPNGLDTELNQNTEVSVGQKQLLTIARAMIQNSPMIILDEATSSVDTRTEAFIQKAMDDLSKGRTSFVIAHRLSTIKNADVIIVMQDGEIVETGNHESLITQNGVYSKLYNSQFEN